MLWCHEGTSDKEYYMRIQESPTPGTYEVYVRYGRRNHCNNEYLFDSGPLDKMEKKVNSQLNKKLAKGYQYSDKALDMI